MSTKSCKNCQHPLLEDDNYCRNCGAKVIRNRLTVKALVQDFYSQTFKWDNRYLVTIKHLLLHPKTIFEEYIDGTRKKYINPITFLTVCAAIILICYNQFTEEYIAMTNVINNPQGNMMNSFFEGVAQGQGVEYNPENSPEFARRMQNNEDVQRTIVKYFNVFIFLLMPYYGFLAYKTFGKPYTYAEHLVVNAYAQGLLFLIGTLTFLLSIYVSPLFFYLSIITSFVYYSYAYAKLYEYGLGKAILKLLRFLVILLLSFLGFIIVAGVIGGILGILWAMIFEK